MRTIVMGGGLIGVTTAYFLAKEGHEVTVLERNEDIGLETSFQNGALLAPGHSQSWASPGAVKALVKSLFQEEPALRFRFSADPRFWRWAVGFVSQCTEANYRANTLRVMRCMSEGVEALRELRSETGIDFRGNDNGILYLFRTQQSLEERASSWTLLTEHGYELEAVDRHRCVEIEPALEVSQEKIAGGFFAPNEGAGDAFVFTRELAKLCKELGVLFRFNTQVTHIQASGDQIEAVVTDRGEVTGGRYVVAFGPYSPVLMRPLGISLPIWPVKGYTVSVNIDGRNGAPQVGIIEEDNLVAFARLDDRLRIGGKADFAGYNTHFEPRDFVGVLAVAHDLFPDGGDYANPKYWACLRPVTAGGPPILGESRYKNLFLNVGHGAAGWTMACSTCKAVAEIVCGRSPGMDMEGLTL